MLKEKLTTKENIYMIENDFKVNIDTLESIMNTPDMTKEEIITNMRMVIIGTGSSLFNTNNNCNAMNDKLFDFINIIEETGRLDRTQFSEFINEFKDYMNNCIREIKREFK